MKADIGNWVAAEVLSLNDFMITSFILSWSKVQKFKFSNLNCTFFGTVTLAVRKLHLFFIKKKQHTLNKILSVHEKYIYLLF